MSLYPALRDVSIGVVYCEQVYSEDGDSWLQYYFFQVIDHVKATGRGVLYASGVFFVFDVSAKITKHGNLKLHTCMDCLMGATRTRSERRAMELLIGGGQ